VLPPSVRNAVPLSTSTECGGLCVHAIGTVSSNSRSYDLLVKYAGDA
jgi:hypothetical protein